MEKQVSALHQNLNNGNFKVKSKVIHLQQVYIGELERKYEELKSKTQFLYKDDLSDKLFKEIQQQYIHKLEQNEQNLRSEIKDAFAKKSSSKLLDEVQATYINKIEQHNSLLSV